MDASSFPFMLVHSDVWGPAPVGSRCGYSYYVTFRLLMISLVVLGFIYLKEEVFSCFKDFIAKSI